MQSPEWLDINKARHIFRCTWCHTWTEIYPNKNGYGNILICLGKALGFALHDGGSSIIRPIRGVTHDTINGAVDHDENLVRNLSSAASKVNNSTGGARKKH